MLFSLAVTLILGAIKEAIKNKQKRADLRAKLMEIRDAVNALYGLEEPEPAE
jgi:hypothetical protein